MNYYGFGFYSLLVMWIYYILEFRWLIKKKVDAVCSKTYIRKNCKGFKNKLFYTPVRERCKLGNVYYLNKYVFITLVIATIAHSIGGNSPNLVPLLKIALTVLYTIIIVTTLIVQPRESREFYTLKAIEMSKTPNKKIA